MKRCNLSPRQLLLAMAICAAANASGQAADTVEVEELTAASFGEALDLGEATLGFRARTERVDTDGTGALDLTSLKTRLTYQSDNYRGFSALIEMDDVTHLSDFEGGVGDPEGTEVNQVLLAYALGETAIKYGRQRILLDNQRFVGGVGFRQNEQTYDGLSVTDQSFTDTTLFLAHIDNVNRIFGEDSPAGDHGNDSYLLNAKYSGFAAGDLSAYAYLLENDDAAAFSTDTYGLRFAGKTGATDYALEYAIQSDAADNPAGYSADYLLAEGGYRLGDLTLKAGYELLGADGVDGQFITPLATLHKFQGWNDMFLGGGTGNIPGGIEDVYASLGNSLGGVELAVNYHQLSSDDSGVSGMDELGSEYGFAVGGKLGFGKLSLKYSRYTADDFSVDTDKLWLTAQAKF
ncbi:alginate export family protein [Microbulbifer halophilus]|uniref:Alginate export family protein n=1 Tax=Microbulbifer halophilus TaxID=453963 RepID=A0ABW5E8R5_9GAMM|nr:alginate export family protein [Microbulbifer halophilus]MCW8125212.1 alginate export family protein [Microbulbifer halophilus]